MTVYTVTSTTPLGTILSNRYYTSDHAEAERGRRIIAGDTNVTLDATTITNKPDTATTTARPGLKGATAHA